MTRPLLLEGVRPSRLPRCASMPDAKAPVVGRHRSRPRIAAPGFERGNTREWRAIRADTPATPAGGPQ